jgi:hypothetical protein
MIALRSPMLRSAFVVFGLATFSFGGAAVAAPQYTIQFGEATQADGWLTARTKTVLELPLAPEANLITLRGKTGQARGAIIVAFNDENRKTVKDREGKEMRSLQLSAAEQRKIGDDAFPDSLIRMNFPLSYFVRPNMRYYKPEARKKFLAKWDSLPAASQHEFKLELRRAENGVLRLWFDGTFMQEYAPAPVRVLRVTLQPGAAVREFAATQSTPAPLLALPIADNPRPAGMENAKLELDAKAGLPPQLKPPSSDAAGIAIGGLSIFPEMVSSDLQSYYWRRTAADNLPEQRMFSVPLATYGSAYILCAMENDPARVNAFTLRVTRYGRSRGNAMADTIVRVPANAADSANARRVGTVSYGAANARQSVPLWLLKVPIKNGLIQDMLYNDDKKSDVMGTYKYLDVELMDPLPGAEEAAAFPPPLEPVRRAWKPTDPAAQGYDFYTSWPPPQISGAHVFGLALEKSPAQMRVNSNLGHQAFYASDKPQFEAKIAADKAGEYFLVWEYADVDGKIVASATKSVKLEVGKPSTLSVPVTVGNGWFAARFRLLSGNDELIDYRTSFVMLPPDTRRAGLESPFYGWWFDAGHGSDIQLDEVGPLLQRLGIRRVGLPEEMPESVTLPKYGFTNSTVSWTQKDGGRQAMREYRQGKKTLAEALAMHEAQIRKSLELWPSIDRMLVFHEDGSGGAPFPSELWGEAATPPDERTTKSWKGRTEYLDGMVKMVREKFPKLKMQWGNDGNSMALLGQVFRQKYPRQYIDTIASEDLGQTIAPERDRIGGTQDGWYLRELARKMGYGDVPVTATTEWIGRMSEKLGRRKQAEWKVRDGLLALAYGYDTISIAGINDAGDGYYYSIWANGGLNERYPILAPKPAYAAVATLTRVLDRARFQRFVPTGSTVCYLEEFQRGDDWVYALWTPRGEREVTLTFPNAAARVLTDLYGRESTLSGAVVQLKANTAVRYLVSPTKLVSAAVGASSFPEDKANVPQKSQETIALESLDVVNLVSDNRWEEQTAKRTLEKEVEGNFEIREVNDSEMGKCIEVELKPGRELQLGETEYATLKLVQPLTTTAKNAGVWIKGNGSWGNVDILKNHWGPWADNGNLHMRWPGDASLNFDGWNFIKYPYYDWIHTEGTNATTKVDGLRITFPRTTLVGTERVPVANQKIRIKSIVLF